MYHYSGSKTVTPNARLLKPVHADQIAKAKRITDRIRAARASQSVVLIEDLQAEQQPDEICKCGHTRAQHSGFMFKDGSRCCTAWHVADLGAILCHCPEFSPRNSPTLSAAEQDKLQHEWI